MDNPYLLEIKKNLPRLLSLIDQDQTSESYGIADRYAWAWGLIDFRNGTFQGMAHGMARLWQAGLWPYSTSKERFIRRIDALFEGTVNCTRGDGSLEEAFPREGSFCVTALAAYDLLCAIDALESECSERLVEKWQGIIEPLIEYLLKANETHAVISNHLATAVAALVRWSQRTGDGQSEKRAEHFLEIILQHQSEEGWFLEYEGADPGYQSLCTYYLADVHQLRPDLGLFTPLKKSLEFLSYFVHPDGSFGGVYGSRCTRFYFPSGVLYLASEIPEAASLARFMSKSIAEQKVVALSSLDEPNLVPMFNAYCWSAILHESYEDKFQEKHLPFEAQVTETKVFNKAGLLIDKGKKHYTVISLHKGGVVYHFEEGRAALIDTGVVVKNPKQKLGSTQSYNAENYVILTDKEVAVYSDVTAMTKKLPTPTEFIILRILGVTFFRSYRFREFVKRRLVNLLITKKAYWPVSNCRRITLGEKLEVEDNVTLPEGFSKVEQLGSFISIHMASQGYWQIQDEHS